MINVEKEAVVAMVVMMVDISTDIVLVVMLHSSKKSVRVPGTVQLNFAAYKIQNELMMMLKTIPELLPNITLEIQGHSYIHSPSNAMYIHESQTNS